MEFHLPANRLLLPLIGASMIATAAIAATITLWATSEARTAQLEVQLQLDRDRADRLVEQLGAYEDQDAGLRAREQTLAAREAEVVAREQAVSAAEAALPVTALEDDRWYTAGASMMPGTYEASTSEASCTWSISVADPDEPGAGELIETGHGAGWPVSVVVEAGQDFSSTGCVSWSLVG
ncbi:hypothetical protein [Agromyces soli]|uniref:Secreted protein n=1 Tax=Agromyces soli TaxID=659012 RepID=A0ABY4AS69_9MICO|nr:hypothetical protein [Agromyces soli]UOE25006.1 hypothetical protein MTP13_11635 [Agromyces soli]